MYELKGKGGKGKGKSKSGNGGHMMPNMPKNMPKKGMPKMPKSK